MEDVLEIRITEDWDRSPFATSVEELEVQETIVAIARVMEHELREDTRLALKHAVEILRRDAA